MKKKIKITVVIPAYNEEKYLPSCLSCLKKQAYQPEEVIVVDNNSKDKTFQIAKKYHALVFKEKKQGMAFARDCGFKYAKGEIVVRTDADTILPPDWLLKIVKNFKKDPDIVGVTGTTQFYDLFPANRWLGSFFNSLSRYWFTFWLYLFKIFAGHNQFNGPNFAVKKEVLTKINPCSDNPYLHEDMDLSCHISCFGKIIFDPSLIVYSSSRRLKKRPFDPFLKYTFMGISTFLIHGHPFLRSHQRGSGLKNLEKKKDKIGRN